jgi:Arc/MetJ-type ribon-helix-helix transcriptional regulator
MERQANTLAGAFSNLQDAITQALTVEGEELDMLSSEIRELTDLLKDPETIKAIQTLTSALVTGFAGAVGIIADVTNGIRGMAEEMARAVHGAADISGALSEIEEHFDRERFLANVSTANIDKNIDLLKSLIGFSSADELESNLKRINTQISEARSFIERGIGGKHARENMELEIAVLEELRDITLRALDAKEQFSASDASAEVTVGLNVDQFDKDLHAFFDGVQKQVDERQKLFASTENSLRKQVVLYGDVSEAAKIRYDIENGELKKLTEGQQEALVNLAVDIDNKNAINSLAEYADKMRDMAVSFTEATDPQALFKAQLKELNDVQKIGGLGIDAYNAKLAEYQEQLNDATPGIQSLKELNEALTDTLTPQEAALEKVRGEMEMLVDAMDLFPEKSDAITSALQRLQTEENEILSNTKSLSEELSAFADQAARNMQDAFADFLFDPFQDGLDGMLAGFLKVIQRMLAEQLAAQIFGSKSDGGFGVGDVVNGLLSFDGGGDTGSGPRTGGVDGKGGFLAVMHPQETVFDHTRNLSGMPGKNAAAPIVNVPPPQVIVVDSMEAAYEAMASPRGSHIQIDNAKKNSTKFNQSLGNS